MVPSPLFPLTVPALEPADFPEGLPPIDSAELRSRQPLAGQLAALSVQPLLLVVHGRSGGVLPPELIRLAADLEWRRGAPVRIQALTAPAPPDPADLVRPGVPLGLVPLLLLPGSHVRHDIPALVAHWRLRTTVRRRPFLGAWPAWQRALRGEVAALAAPVELWHHPLDGPLAHRYLRHLEQHCAARCRPASAGEAGGEGGAASSPASVLPLTLAANRLTDALEQRLGAAVTAPLLARPRLYRRLLALLEALP
jgi:sirohydrochlorin ferrochelatase